ncbi:hypothetical protein GCM10009851_39670 [Herbiconiux moechotypicola]|uniref:Uncharacterized protein n=1 Tax=Herbiconiux moechotypicola TaxID=637393 RepID=A0ABN3E6Z2_9MICO
MKRRLVLKRVRTAARQAGLDYVETELTNHTGITVGGTRSTLGRHREIDEVTVRKFWAQFDEVFGKGWWR